MAQSGFLRARPRDERVTHALDSIQHFIRSAVVGSIILLICAVIAIIWANSQWSDSYFDLWETDLAITLGDHSVSFTLHEWVNEGLMMFFFLLVGLEVKEQILVGELSSIRKAMLPVAAAFGGMVVPALIFALINSGGEGESGWGIPMATDIAFALGILALLGPRVPLSLKVFLAALAIADDIGAIIVITLFYTSDIVFEGLLLAGFFWLVILILSRFGIYNTLIYFTLAIGVWVGFMISGVHATIAGVLVALAIPAHSLVDSVKVQGEIKQLWKNLDEKLPNFDLRSGLRDKEEQEIAEKLEHLVHEVEPPLTKVEHSLNPFVTFVVIPLFALSNAGVKLGGGNLLDELVSPISLGVILGLFVGKQVGITFFTWLMVKVGWAELPEGITLRHIHAVSVLAGIGFTVALFITELAYVTEGQLEHVAHAMPPEVENAKIGILCASFIAGVVGYILLRGCFPKPQPEDVETAE
jgi:Na+:H+ antiporter, NhaA family